jgi:phosphatidylinositol glycan class N
LLAVGLVFHLTYMLSKIDIYCRSPLVQGIAPVMPSIEAPAKRLVLFVGIARTLVVT